MKILSSQRETMAKKIAQAQRDWQWSSLARPICPTERQVADVKTGQGETTETSLSLTWFKHLVRSNL